MVNSKKISGSAELRTQDSLRVKAVFDQYNHISIFKDDMRSSNSLNLKSLPTEICERGLTLNSVWCAHKSLIGDWLRYKNISANIKRDYFNALL